MKEPVVFREAEHLLVVTLNRPETRNAVSMAMAQALSEIMDYFESASHLRAAVITGAGQTFCSGMDLKAFSKGEGVPVVSPRGFAGFVERPPNKPIVAAVEGFALGGGFEIVLACDLVVAATDAKFGLTEVQRGIAPSGGGLLRLATRVSYNQAMEIALTGGRFSSSRLADLGLVNRLADPGGALEVAMALAEKIASNAPLAVLASKQILERSLAWSIEEGFEKQLPFLLPVRASSDAREGAAAFAEKRAPVWSGV